MGFAILFLLICFFFVPFMNRWDKKREARIEKFKERLSKIGLPDLDEEEDFVEEIDSTEEALVAKILLPPTNTLDASVESLADSDSDTKRGVET